MNTDNRRRNLMKTLINSTQFRSKNEYGKGKYLFEKSMAGHGKTFHFSRIHCESFISAYYKCTRNLKFLTWRSSLKYIHASILRKKENQLSIEIEIKGDLFSKFQIPFQI